MKKVKEETYIPESTIEELVEINLDPNNLEKKMLVGTQMSKEEMERLLEYLRKNKDVFAWSHRDIQGVNPEEVKHFFEYGPILCFGKRKTKKIRSKKEQSNKRQSG